MPVDLVMPLHSSSVRITLSRANLARLVNYSQLNPAVCRTLWEKIKDFFSGCWHKAQALACLHQLLNTELAVVKGGLDATINEKLYHFAVLQSLAAPGYEAAFRLAFMPDTTQALLIIGQTTVARLDGAVPIALQQQFALQQVKVRQQRYEQLAGQLADFVLPNMVASLPTTRGFEHGKGGKHKAYNPADGTLSSQSCMLPAFNVEKCVANKAQSCRELHAVCSTQRLVVDADGVPKLVKSNGKSMLQAQVSIYAEAVSGQPLDVWIAQADQKVAPSVRIDLACQIINFLRVCYKKQIAHRDLHGHNFMLYSWHVSPNAEQASPASTQLQSVYLLQGIDFGKAKLDAAFESTKFADIRYMFQQEACGHLETWKRNLLRRVCDLSNAQAKHYPLDKLLLPLFANDRQGLRKALSIIGLGLEQELRRIPSGLVGAERGEWVDIAFNNAMLALQLAVERRQNRSLLDYLLVPSSRADTLVDVD